MDDLNPYSVADAQPHPAGPLLFHHLPKEIRLEVFKRTPARFEVAHHMEVALHTLELGVDRSNIWLRRLPFVPVVLRYQFRLEPRLAVEPRMTATFSRSLDPVFQQSALWQQCPAALKARIERAAAKKLEIPPFSELKFEELGVGYWIFCFVHEEGGMARGRGAWTRFPRDSAVLDEVRAKMQRMFYLPCNHG